MSVRPRRGREPPAGAVPLPPRRKWRAILLATVLLAPGFWSIVIGLVAGASDDRNAPAAAPFIAFGLAIVPFVFVALAFLSEHPRAAGAVLRAMALCLLVGAPTVALAGDAVTGLVAGIAAGGAVALRMEPAHSGRSRALAVVVVTAYTFVVVRVAPEVAFIAAPVLPFTSIGVADHLRERRLERRPEGR
jgi:hypothetical protein